MTSITQAFQTFKENLEPTGIQVNTISTRQTHIREVVEAGMTVIDSFLTGSYSRSTLIAPLKKADVDIFMVLDSSYFHHYNGQNGGPGGLLDVLKRTLRKTYTKTPGISRNGQAVTIRFTDFMVDVVPGFDRKGGGFLIPNSIMQSWISTDPKRHVQIVSSANAAHNGQLIPLIKMIKAWNRQIDEEFCSFHLEILALAALQNVTISDYPSGLRYFLDKGRSLVSQKNPDPAGYSDDIGFYLNTADKVEAAVSNFQAAYELALRAESYALYGQIESAITTWQTLLGDYFPGYG